jgi:transposase
MERHYEDQARLLTQVRKNDGDLRLVHSQVLQQVLLRLDKAFQAFFKGLTKYPTFKRSISTIHSHIHNQVLIFMYTDKQDQTIFEWKCKD